MKRTAVFAIAFVFSSVVLVAQDTARPNTVGGENHTLTILQLSPAIVGCPVGMRARHEFGLHRVYVGNHSAPEPSGMRLNFVLTSPRQEPITSASITVRGLDGRSHIVQTGDRVASPDIEKTMSVNLIPGEDRNSNADLIAPGFVVVNSIELNSVTYSSGATWKFGGNQVCQIAPDPLMLVSAQMAR
jgi:hypothetical protein